MNVEYPMDEIWSAIEECLTEKINPIQGAFRISQEDSTFDSYIHADGLFAKWAAVIYLTPFNVAGCQTGTAFWRHKQTGQDRMTEPYDPKLVEQWKDPANFEQTYSVQMICNRLIVYPTQYFHSPWPHHGFGTTPENSRMIWIGFFNIKA